MLSFSIMRRTFVSGLIDTRVVHQGLKPVSQGSEQGLQHAELGLLIRERGVELGQELLLVSQLRLDIDQAVFVQCQHLRLQLPTLRRQRSLINPAR